jgi:hypothetical protein
MQTLKHNIRLMRWHCPNRIFAKSHTIRGKIILWFRGYRKHETLFGTVVSKEVK